MGLIGEENDFGSDHVAIGDVYFRAMDFIDCRSLLESFMSKWASTGHRRRLSNGISLSGYTTKSGLKIRHPIYG